MTNHPPLCILLAACGMASLAQAAAPVQKVKPPITQVSIDLATFSGNIPAMPSGGVSGALGSLFGSGPGAARGNLFGNTQHAPSGRWMDVTLTSSRNPRLSGGDHLAPAASKFGTPLKLLAPEEVKPEPSAPETLGVAGMPEMPKGKMYLYWGCSAEVRKGQPLVLDMSKLDRTQIAKFFQNRGASAPAPTPAPGRPAWPNKSDDRLLPAGASMVGEHAFSGQGVPDGVLVSIGAAHDLMPAIDVRRSDEGGAVVFRWQAMSQARAWFISSMGARTDGAQGSNGEMEMVFWTSSELPDMGSGLLNYQPNAAVDKWLKEKVVLPATSTECLAPKEAVGPMSMTRMIAYGDELNLAHPPRPRDPKITWEPEWAAKVRLKSVAMLMPGIGSMAVAGSSGSGQAADKAPAETAGAEVKKSLLEGAASELFKGLFNRK